MTRYHNQPKANKALVPTAGVFPAVQTFSDSNPSFRIHAYRPPAVGTAYSFAQPCASLAMTKYLVAALILARAAYAGESSLTVTYQPLDGLGSGSIHIAQVTCHDWYSHSGQATQLGLISAPNVPPTNNPKEATENLNLASVCGLGFGSSDLGHTKATLELTMVANDFKIPEKFGHPREVIIRASLECLRLCLPERLRKTPVTLMCRETDRTWMEKIVSEFNAHDRTKAFFTPKS